MSWTSKTIPQPTTVELWNCDGCCVEASEVPDGVIKLTIQERQLHFCAKCRPVALAALREAFPTASEPLRGAK